MMGVQLRKGQELAGEVFQALTQRVVVPAFLMRRLPPVLANLGVVSPLERQPHTPARNH
jgi:hypothetical protein